MRTFKLKLQSDLSQDEIAKVAFSTPSRVIDRLDSFNNEDMLTIRHDKDLLIGWTVSLPTGYQVNKKSIKFGVLPPDCQKLMFEDYCNKYIFKHFDQCKVVYELNKQGNVHIHCKGIIFN